MSQQAIAIRSQAHHLYRQGEFDAAIETLGHAWQALPEPRERQSTASAIAAELAAIHLFDRADPFAAEHWADTLSRCDGPHATPHEVALLRGRIDLARGDVHAARHHLTAAWSAHAV
jgi:uncharacterized protein HemY